MKCPTFCSFSEPVEVGNCKQMCSELETVKIVPKIARMPRNAEEVAVSTFTDLEYTPMDPIAIYNEPNIQNSWLNA